MPRAARNCATGKAKPGLARPAYRTQVNIFMRDFWDEGAHAPVTEMRELMLPLMGETLSTGVVCVHFSRALAVCDRALPGEI